MGPYSMRSASEKNRMDGGIVANREWITAMREGNGVRPVSGAFVAHPWIQLRLIPHEREHAMCLLCVILLFSIRRSEKCLVTRVHSPSGLNEAFKGGWS